MNIQRKQPFLFQNVDPLLQLSDVENVLRNSRVFYSIPSRPTLIQYCEDGTFESLKLRGQYFVYESSLLSFINSLQRQAA